jgi:hypothetical protein
MSGPQGVVVELDILVSLFASGTGFQALWLTNPAIADAAPANGSLPLATVELGVSVTSAAVSNAQKTSCITNRSGQIGLRDSSSTAVQLQTVDWTDPCIG